MSQATLNRFFSVHFLLPFAVAALSALHLLFLHDKGSTSPLGQTTSHNKVTFHPYFSWKDIAGFAAMLLVLFAVVLFRPNLVADPENFIVANPIVTPVHIQPE